MTSPKVATIALILLNIIFVLGSQQSDTHINNSQKDIGEQNEIINRTELLWPLPSKITLNSSAQQTEFDISDITFKIQAISSDYIQQVINHYISKVFKSEGAQSSAAQITMNIVVRNSKLMFANVSEHEKYQLTIRQNQKWELIADYYPGFVRGFQTFSQLLERKQNGKYIIRYRPVLIDDQPTFIWRGLMIDTARHYLPMDQIKKIMDGLMYNKMNVLHWHIIDQDSFPMEVPTRPELCSFGKLSGMYTTANLKQLIEYAKARSIRVIPEYDTPAHTRSWGVSPNLSPIVIQGRYPYQGEFNPIINLTYEVVNDVIKYVNSVFIDSYTHLGGDQIEDAIWDTKPQIKQWMTKHNMTQYDELQIYYRKTEREMLRTVNSSKKAIYWANQQIDLPVDAADVIQWWGQTVNVDQIKPRKNQIILSNYDLAYLDVGFGDELGDPYRWHVSWRQIYEGFQPMIKDVNVIGGEGCIWSELTNKDNIQQKVWIRSCSLAERLWNTGVNIKGNLLNIVRRLIAQRKRMQDRGFKVSPVTVGLCQKSPQICFSQFQ